MDRVKFITFVGLGILDLAAAAYALKACTRELDNVSLNVPPALSLAPAPAKLSPDIKQESSVEALNRPLFVKSRRPPVGEPQATNDSEANPLGIKMRAVVMEGQRPRAYLVAGDATDGKWLQVGDQVDSWRIDVISADAITLRRAERSVSIGFDYSGAVKTAR